MAPLWGFATRQVVRGSHAFCSFSITRFVCFQGSELFSTSSDCLQVSVFECFLLLTQEGETSCAGPFCSRKCGHSRLLILETLHSSCNYRPCSRGQGRKSVYSSRVSLATNSSGRCTPFEGAVQRSRGISEIQKSTGSSSCFRR
jgi:hypothetical protein